MNKTSDKFKRIGMGEIDKNFSYLCVSQSASIISAMEVIENGKERICFVIDDKNKLIKVITDGDIRRALLRGSSPSDKVKKIHDRQPIVAKENNAEQVLQHLSKWVTIIPVVDINNRMTGLLRFNDFLSSYNIRERSVAIIGLGYVGLTLSVILADNGFSVTGLDKDKELVNKLKNADAPFYENGLENLLKSHVGYFFKPTSSEAQVFADIYIITVGTPVDYVTKKPDIKHIERAVLITAKKLKKGDLVILRSTVPIGCTRNTVIPILQKMSGLKVGLDFFVAFCPERTAEGKALKELRELPQIVGGFDQNSRQLAMNFFSENTHTVIDVGSLEAAELCKLIDNTFRDTVFAYSNQMATLSEKLGLNLNEIVTKVNLGYERNKIPYPSPGVGGPCLSKDPYILQSNFSEFELDCSLTVAARKVNERSPRHIYDRCKALLSEIGKNINKEKIFIVGFAFKGEPVTSDLRDSTTVFFLKHLFEMGIKEVWGYDPIIAENDLLKLGISVCSLEEGFENAGAVFIMNNHRSYTDINIVKMLASMSKPSIFYDGWNMFPAQDLRKIPGIIYAAPGSG